MREKTLIQALHRAEIAVAVGFAAAMPLVSYLDDVGGFRLPFQAGRGSTYERQRNRERNQSPRHVIRCDLNQPSRDV